MINEDKENWKIKNEVQRATIDKRCKVNRKKTKMEEAKIIEITMKITIKRKLKDQKIKETKED